MAGFDYSRPLATANRLIERFGQAGAVRRQTKTGPAHNPIITTADHPATFAVLSFDSRDIDGTRVLATDKRALLKVGGLAVTPTTDDKLVIGGVAHSIIDVETLSPAGTALLHTLQCRR